MIADFKQRRRSLAGVIAAMGVVNLVYGITFPLMALVLDGQGISKTLIGLSTMSQACAILLMAPFAPHLMRRFTPARLMQTAAVTLAALFVVAGLIPNVWFWFPLRFVIGAFNAMLWASSETLINDLAGERWRGRVIGIYSSVGAAGYALGPLLLIATGSDGMLPFCSTSALILCAAFPLFAARDHHLVPVTEETQTGVWGVVLLAPAIMLTNLVCAASIEAQATFFPLFGLSLGISENFALWLLTMIGVGSMVFTFPLSWLADHVNRLGLLLSCIGLTMLGLLAMPHVLAHPLLAQLFALAFGGVEGMIYALGLMLLGERFKGPMLAAASTTFTASWAAGILLGPFVVGAGMDWFGADSMALLVFGLFALYFPVPLVAWLRSRRECSKPG
jgi:MFS family permease